MVATNNRRLKEIGRYNFFLNCGEIVYTQRTTKNVSVSKTRLQRMRDFNGVMKSIQYLG